MLRNNNLELEECLLDKSANAFTSAPEFAELVAMVSKFGELLALSPFTYFDLELALQQEAQQQPSTSSMFFQGQQQQGGHSQLIENLLAEILHFFGRLDKSNPMQKKLYWLIVSLNRWSTPQFNARLLLPKEKEDEKTQENGGIVVSSLANGGVEQQKQEDEVEEADEEGRKSSKSLKIDDEQSREQSVSAGSQQSAEEKSQTATEAEGTPISSNRSLRTMGNTNSNTKKLSQLQQMPDYMNLSSEDKLRMFCFLVDAQLACAHDSQLLDQGFSDEQQRNAPLVIDSAGRKFWYFCDTWLFMEEGRLLDAEEEERKQKEWDEKRKKKMTEDEEERSKLEEEQMKKKKAEEEKKSKKKDQRNRSRKGAKGKMAKKKNGVAVEASVTGKRLTQQELDQVYAQLFTGRRLRVVCKCSDHFSQLIAAYKGHQRNAKQQQNGEVIEKLEQCQQRVQTVERERLEKLLAEEQAKKSSSPSRHSSRIAYLMEKRRQEAEERRAREEALGAERKRIEREQAEFMREHRRLTDSDIQMSSLSREERLKQRQQRIEDQQEREQLIEAGLLTPSLSTTEPEEDEYGEEEDLNDLEYYGGGGGMRRSRKRPSSSIGRDRGGMPSNVRVLMSKSDGRQQMVRKASDHHRLRMGANDWWTPAPSSSSLDTGQNQSYYSSPFSFGYNFPSLVQTRNSPLKKLANAPRNQRSEGRRMTLIAPSSATSTASSSANSHWKLNNNVVPVLKMNQSTFCLPNTWKAPGNSTEPEANGEDIAETPKTATTTAPTNYTNRYGRYIGASVEHIRSVLNLKIQEPSLSAEREDAPSCSSSSSSSYTFNNIGRPFPHQQLRQQKMFNGTANSANIGRPPPSKMGPTPSPSSSFRSKQWAAVNPATLLFNKAYEPSSLASSSLKHADDDESTEHQNS